MARAFLYLLFASILLAGLPPLHAEEARSAGFRNTTLEAPGALSASQAGSLAPSNPASPSKEPPPRRFSNIFRPLELAGGARRAERGGTRRPSRLAPPAAGLRPKRPTSWIAAAGLYLAAGLALAGGLYLFYSRRLRPQDRDLLATLAHELKTPLSAMESYLELMLHEREMTGATAESVQRWVRDVQKMKVNTAELKVLLENILDLHRMKSGKMEYALHPLDSAGMRELACEVADLFRAKAGERGLVVSLELDPGLPPVLADRRALRRVWINLLSNAVKFTPAGGRIGVSAAPLAAGLRALDLPIGSAAPRPPLTVFCVEDSGCGIPPPKTGGDGTGLGLHICRAIVEAHGGRMWVESEPGKGSRFYFSLRHA